MLHFPKEDFVYCEQILPKVSRTFALNIKVLKGPLHQAVLVAYLVCRILDTVEDSSSLSAEQKKEALESFIDLLKKQSNSCSSFKRWAKELGHFCPHTPEQDLIDNSDRVIQVYLSLPIFYQEIALTLFQTMAIGMVDFIERFSKREVAVLSDAQELDEYCYYVAGTVGEFLCSAFIQDKNLSGESVDVMRENAVAFGQGLQLTNIAKDIMQDRKTGRTYVPRSMLEQAGMTWEEFTSSDSKNEQKTLEVLNLLITKAHLYLRDAFTFTLAIPKSCVRMRLFCLWPLWMAMETLLALKGNMKVFASSAPVKISRRKVKTIIWKTTLTSMSDSLLIRDFKKMDKRLEQAYGTTKA